MPDDLDEQKRLVARCVAGDGEAWRLFSARYAPVAGGAAHRVFSARRGRPPHPEEVQEVVQEVLVRLSRDGARLLARYDWRRPLEAYVLTAAAVCAVDRMRTAAARGPAGLRVDLLAAEGEVPARERDPQELAAGRELAREMERVVEALPSRDRLVVRMRFWDGAPSEAIAQALGTTPAYVRVILQRALEKLRESLSRA